MVLKNTFNIVLRYKQIVKLPFKLVVCLVVLYFTKYRDGAEME